MERHFCYPLKQAVPDRLNVCDPVQIGKAQATCAPGRSANCPRLFLARRNRQCSRPLAGGSCSLARGFRSASRCARAEGRRRCRPAHPHRRRKAPVRLPVVGVRLRGTLLRRNPMARFRQRASACRDRRLPWAGTAFRRAPPAACARRRRMIRRRPW